MKKQPETLVACTLCSYEFFNTPTFRVHMYRLNPGADDEEERKGSARE